MNVSGVPAAVAVGEPEIVPFADSVSPAGSTPSVSAQESGAVPPLALKVAVYARPTCPYGNELVVTLSAASGSGGAAWLLPPPQLHNSGHCNVKSSTVGPTRRRWMSFIPCPLTRSSLNVLSITVQRQTLSPRAGSVYATSRQHTCQAGPRPS